MSAPNSPKTKSGANGKFLPKHQYSHTGVWGGILKILASRTFLIFLVGRVENQKTDK